MKWSIKQYQKTIQNISKSKTGPDRLFSNMWSFGGLWLGSWWWKDVLEGMCPYRKYLVNVLRTLVLEKDPSKWIMCGLVILPFQGFVDLVTFPCNFFLPCGVLGAVGSWWWEGVVWGGGVKEIIPGVFTMANTYWIFLEHVYCKTNHLNLNG